MSKTSNKSKFVAGKIASSILVLITFLLINIIMAIIYMTVKRLFLFPEEILLLGFFVINGLLMYLILNTSLNILFSDSQKDAKNVLGDVYRQKNIYKNNTLEEIKFINQSLVSELMNERQKNLEIQKNILNFISSIETLFFEITGTQKSDDILVNFEMVNKNLYKMLSNYQTQNKNIKSFVNELTYHNNKIKDQLDINPIDSENLFEVLNKSKKEEESFINTFLELKEVLNNTYKKIQEITKLSEDVYGNTTAAARTSIESDLHIKQLVPIMDDLESSINKSIELIVELSNSMCKVENIINTIIDISTQTDLLALNASIEAARAGEHGKGFAVVSDNIKKLAKKTSLSINEIEELIKSTQDKTNKVAEVIKLTSSNLKKGYQEVVQSVANFSKIEENINNINNMMGNVHNSTIYQSKNHEHLIDSFNIASKSIKMNLNNIIELEKSIDMQNKKTYKNIEAISELTTFINEKKINV
ncbi:hypothetical protein HZA55_01985 [Candidatus Poribacteria bacterium]|nr:hypothetical protein [Candidatus Poribacteria bacterium]